MGDNPYLGEGTSSASVGGSNSRVVYMNFNLNEIKSIVPKFDPSEATGFSAREWLHKVSVKGRLYQWNDHQMLTYASMCLEGPSRDWYEMNIEEITSWNVFKERLVQCYPDDVNVAGILTELGNKKRRPEQSIDDYFNEVVKTGKRAKLSEEGIKQYLIQGLNEENMRLQLSCNQGKPLNDFLIMMRVLERGKIPNKAVTDKDKMDTPKDSNPVKDKDSPNKSSQKRRSPLPPHKRRTYYRNRRPYKYDSKSGGASEERKKQYDRRSGEGRCYSCNEKGHYIRDCPKRKKSSKGGSSKPRSEQDFQVRVVQPATQQKNKLVRSVTVSINAIDMTAFVDTGSSFTLIQKSAAEKLGWKGEGERKMLSGFGGGCYNTLGTLTAHMQIDKIGRMLSMHVVPDAALDTPMIIGFDFIKDTPIVIAQTGREVVFYYENEDPMHTTQERLPTITKKRNLAPLTAEMVNINPSLAVEQRNEILSLINEFRGCFSLNQEELGHTHLCPLKITLKEEKIIRHHPYRVPYNLQSQLNSIIDKMLELDIIEESDSEYASPIVLIKKADGEYRLTIDFRELNKIIVKIYFPLPNIEEELNKLAGKKCFISLDLMSGYHQMEVEPESRKYTAFVTPKGHYQHKRVPQGLAISAPAFIRMVSKVLKPVLGENVSFYVDDILIHTNSFEEALEVLRAVLSVLLEAGLTLKVKKCHFCYPVIQYLGHEVDVEGVRPGNNKTIAISDFARPTNQRIVRQYLGLTGYFRRFIPKYSEIAAPLYALLRKKAKFVWTEKQEKAYLILKFALTNQPVLTLYVPTDKHEVFCDASSHGLGGILMQIDQEGISRPVSYFSRCTTDQESVWSSYELETIALVETLRRFRYYLLGKHFIVYTDCRSLEQAYSKRKMIDKIARWFMEIQEYDFEIRYKAGKQMEHVDFLSRNPVNADEKAMILAVSEPPNWIVALQSKDEKIWEVKRLLEGSIEVDNQKKKVEQDFALKKGVIYRRTADGLRFYVPKGVRHHVVFEAHNRQGHLSLAKTVEKLSKTYWFPAMRPWIKKYIDSCLPCNMVKAGPDEHHETLYTVERKPIPFHVVHIDHCGPFPRGPLGVQYVVAIVDSFTKFVILRAVKTANANGVVKVLNSISEFVGMPARIVTDKGKAFDSAVFKEHCEDHGIQHSMVAVRTPKANGQVERYFRVVAESLKAMVQDGGSNWVKHLSAIQWSINSTKHRVTGQTPQMMLFGFEPRDIMGNKLLNTLGDEVDRDDKGEVDITELRERICHRINEMQTKQADKYNETHKAPRTYQEGDLVLIRWEPPPTGGSRKLLPKYRGPYRINKVLECDRYEITDTEATQITQKPFKGVYTAALIKPWGSRAEIEEDDWPTQEEDMPEDEVMEIIEID